MHPNDLRSPHLLSALLILAGILAGCATTPATTSTTSTTEAAGARVSATAAAPLAAPAAPAQPVTKNDYANGANWLCRPGRTDACSTDLTSTLLPSDGAPKRQGWESNPLAPVDCFYVYPTISNDATPNSDMTAGPEEKRAVAQQFARFGSECRLFAPVYRQVSLAGLRTAMQGGTSAIDPKMAYGDVVNAWDHYLKHDNKGRGVILIGHSQGARMLSELLKYEIEGKPVQRQLVSAYLIGFNIGVARGKDTGGAFSQLPLCRAPGQTGCVIAYTTFREKSPPPANSRFGRMTGDVVAACTNPAALAGGRGQLDAYLPARTNLLGQPAIGNSWATATQIIDTPFVAAPAFTSAECVERDNASYLAVSTAPAYLAKGIDLPGDLVVSGRLLDDWGLHLVDMDLAMGNLITLARQQAQAYARMAR